MELPSTLFFFIALKWLYKALNHRFLLLPFAFWTVVIFGCESDLLSPDVSRTKSYYSLEELSSDELDPLFTDALLTFDGAVVYNDLHTPNFVYTVAAKAMFTNDSTAEDVDFVSVNEIPLLKEAPGQYLPASLDYPQPYRANWIVKGYEGNNFKDASNSLRELQYTELKAGDTVLKSSGFTIKYTGHSDGDLIVSVEFDRSITYVFGDTVLANTGKGSLEKTIVDNGSVSISSSELTGFTPGGYISINIEHWEYHQVYIKSGRRIGVKNRYSTSIPLFLKGQ